MEFTILLYSIHIVVVLLLAIICTSVATLYSRAPLPVPGKSWFEVP
jgi:hypothetical protein